MSTPSFLFMPVHGSHQAALFAVSFGFISFARICHFAGLWPFFKALFQGSTGKSSLVFALFFGFLLISWCLLRNFCIGGLALGCCLGPEVLLPRACQKPKKTSQQRLVQKNVHPQTASNKYLPFPVDCGLELELPLALGGAACFLPLWQG